MTVRTMMASMALTAVLAAPAVAAPMMTAKQFVTKAGASDLFERKEGMLMENSANPAVANFAKKMIADHTKSTDMVKAAAKADGMMPAPPMMSAMQQADYMKLKASSGTARDRMYVTQQKAAHAKALDLMQGYAANGSKMHLKQAAGQIAPVVQSHIDMLGQMNM